MSDQAVIDYLKANGLFDTFASAAGVSKSTPDAGDVHKPSASSKPKPAPTAGAKPEEDANAAADAVDKRAIAAGDIVFAKADANLYVARWLTPESAQRLHEWAEAQGFKNVIPSELMHVTVVHSSTPVTGMTPAQDSQLVGPGRWLSTLGKDGKALVMMFSSPDLQERFKQFKAAGATWDFPSYMPHITLSYDAGDDAGAVWSMVEAPTFDLLLGPETFQDSNSNWVDDNGLVDKSFDLPFTVTKAEPDRQMLFGWASVSSVNGVEIIDKQGDIVPIEELEKAAYDFTLYSRQHGDMHERVGTGRLVESMVFTPEKAAVGLVAKNQNGEQMFGWWVAFKVDDPDVWALAKAGKLPEFSIGGKATPVPA